MSDLLETTGLGVNRVLGTVLLYSWYITSTNNRCVTVNSVNRLWCTSYSTHIVTGVLCGYSTICIITSLLFGALSSGVSGDETQTVACLGSVSACLLSSLIFSRIRSCNSFASRIAVSNSPSSCRSSMLHDYLLPLLL